MLKIVISIRQNIFFNKINKHLLHLSKYIFKIISLLQKKSIL